VLYILNPCLSEHFLFLCGDVHSNPGPNGGLHIWLTKVNSLPVTAESGKRFFELMVWLESNDIHVAGLSETGCKLNLPNHDIEGYHQLDNTLTILRAGFTLRIPCPIKINNRSPSQSTLAKNQYFSDFDVNVSNTLKQKSDVVFGGDLKNIGEWFTAPYQ
jgi:hypothetical protein